MSNTSLKKYYPPKQSRAEIIRQNWQVMKPFVKFGFKAIGIIGGALISIVKLLPTLAPDHKKTNKKDNRVIKI
jgi:hypothetical protein